MKRDHIYNNIGHNPVEDALENLQVLDSLVGEKYKDYPNIRECVLNIKDDIRVMEIIRTTSSYH